MLLNSAHNYVQIYAAVLCTLIPESLRALALARHGVRRAYIVRAHAYYQMLEPTPFLHEQSDNIMAGAIVNCLSPTKYSP